MKFKLKTLFVLIACACLLLGASSVCAEDIDDSIDENQTVIDIAVIDDEYCDDKCSCGVTGETDFSDVFDVELDVNPYIGPVKIDSNASNFVAKDLSSLNASDSFDEDAFISLDSYVSRETLCFNDDQYSFDLNDDDNVSIMTPDDNISDDFRYYYNYYNQANTSVAFMAMPAGLDEEEIAGTGNRNLRKALTVNCNQELTRSLMDCQENDFADFDLSINDDANTLNADFTVDLADSWNVDFSNFDYNALEINLYSDDSDIMDYNLEYSIISNPHLIVEEQDDAAEDLLLFGNGMTHHCSKDFDAKITITETIISNNSLFKNDQNCEEAFNHELLTFKNSILEDNCEDFCAAADCTLMIDTITCFEDTAYLSCSLEETGADFNNMLSLIGKSTPNLSDESTADYLLIFGGIEKC